MHKTKGFTLIELVIVIVILGILSAIVIPKYIDLTTSATNAAKAGMSGGVKSSLAIAIAELKRYPTVTELGTYVTGQNVTVTTTGIQVVINGNNATVPTFTDSACANATAAANNTVMCVGSIP